MLHPPVLVHEYFYRMYFECACPKRKHSRNIRFAANSHPYSLQRPVGTGRFSISIASFHRPPAFDILFLSIVSPNTKKFKCNVNKNLAFRLSIQVVSLEICPLSHFPIALKVEIVLFGLNQGKEKKKQNFWKCTDQQVEQQSNSKT